MSVARAVLWDMDGTLIDSEEQHWISWRNTLAKEGIVITREQFLATFGQRNDSIIPQLLGAAATPERIERISEAKEELYRHLIRRDGISPLPGVASWLDRLHKDGWLQAIASAAPRANIDVVLEALSATHIFQSIVSAEDVQKGKPDPEVYLKAASRVGAAPENAIVVEDAAAGIEGARRAGMRSIGVSHDGQHLPADVVVQSLALLDSDAFETLLQTSNCVFPDLLTKPSVQRPIKCLFPARARSQERSFDTTTDERGAPMNADETFTKQVQAEARSGSGLLYERLEHLRSLLRKNENELSSAVRLEYDVTFVQYLRSVFNPEANCRLTVVRSR